MTRAALAALLLGCSGVPVTVSEPAMDASDAARPQIVDSEPPPASEPGYVPRRWFVFATGDAFYPDTLTIHRGDTVEWSNASGWRTSLRSGFLCMHDGLFAGPLPTSVTFPIASVFPYYTAENCGAVGVIVVH